MELQGRAALVTGAGQRLGLEFAQALAGRGMRLALHFNRSAGGAEALRDRILGRGGSAEVFQADLTDAGAARALGGRVARHFGGLDVLVNSAAVMHKLAFEETTPEQYDEVLALNLRAPFFVGQGAALQKLAAFPVIERLLDDAVEPGADVGLVAVADGLQQ